MTVRGRFLAPNGVPLSGAIVFRAPAQLTFPRADVILGGPVTVQLDAQGGFEVTLPATDAPDMDPSGWAYIVTEQLAGIPVGRSYNVVLPRAQPEVDLADIAPTDPSKPNYVGVPGATGPQGERGPSGAPGSVIYSGAAAPAAALGIDGDLYVRYETTVFLGVTSTTVSTWQKTAGTWAQLGGDVRGAAIYTNNATTPSTSTKPGDLLIRTDTGDVWQRSASGWGSPVGNLRGPKGDKGDPGAAGATGQAGVVQSVNGKSSAAVVLSAADVGALATGAAGTAGGVATLGPDGKVPAAQLPTLSGGGAVASVNGKTGAVVLAAADVGALDLAAADARYVQPSGVPVTSVAGKTGAVTLAAGDVGAEAAGTAVLLTGTQTVAGAKTFSSVPSSSAAPTADTHLARKSYVDALGGGEFRASDLGLLSWAFDPALGHSAPLYPGSGPIRVTAVYLRSAASVTKIAWHFGGYAGGLTTGSWAALYNASGTRVAQTADLSTAAAEPAEVHNTGGATVSVPLTAAYSAPAGLYYVAWRFQYNTTAGDGPMMLVAESSFSAPPNVFGLTPVRRFGSYPTGAATAPASITLGSMENGSNRFWAALA
ncbi:MULTISPECIES: hypothetical protein [unclassified Streptomyces]|uniref:hypothetical protein n=1 Tax=unclassified Streptomyces TaxID=2593676 RepID=UPI00131A63B2|nr:MULTISPECIES: hypothetical protein [unclassified Streptomyces]